MMRLLGFLMISIIALGAQETKRIPQIVMDAYLNNECLKVNGIIYPNFIRLNLDKDVVKAKELGYKIKNKILKCGDAQKCSLVVNELLDIGINNIDMGPYQINYFYQAENWNDNGDYSAYFDIEESENRARHIVNKLIDTYGYSWRTLGRYHHYDPKNKARNIAYYKRLYRYIYGETPRIASAN